MKRLIDQAVEHLEEDRERVEMLINRIGGQYIDYLRREIDWRRGTIDEFVLIG